MRGCSARSCGILRVRVIPGASRRPQSTPLQHAAGLAVTRLDRGGSADLLIAAACTSCCLHESGGSRGGTCKPALPNTSIIGHRVVREPTRLTGEQGKPMQPIASITPMRKTTARLQPPTWGKLGVTSSLSQGLVRGVKGAILGPLPNPRNDSFALVNAVPVALTDFLATRPDARATRETRSCRTLHPAVMPIRKTTQF